MQVELAQLRHRMPRLRGGGEAASQQGGDRHADDPRNKPEIDRRHHHVDVAKLERELEQVARSGDMQRKSRSSDAVTTVRAGRTHQCGKSTLLNRLTQADVPWSRLFSTLDPATAAWASPVGRPCSHPTRTGS